MNNKIGKRKMIKQKQPKAKRKEGKEPINNKLEFLGRYAVLIIGAVVFIYLTLQTLGWLYSNIKTGIEYGSLYKKILIEDGNADENKSPKLDFSKLKETNENAVGWIKVDSVGINYPILQTDNNEYYKKKDIYKSYNKCGSIILDNQNSNKFTDKHTILYGQNLIMGEMFEPLNKIVKGKAGTDVEVVVLIEGKAIHYKVFSSYTEKSSSEKLEPKLNESEKYKEFMKNITEKTNMDYGVKASNSDKTLTLSTIDRTGKKRVVIHAVKTTEERISK